MRIVLFFVCFSLLYCFVKINRAKHVLTVPFDGKLLLIVSIIIVSTTTGIRAKLVESGLLLPVFSSLLSKIEPDPSHIGGTISTIV